VAFSRRLEKCDRDVPRTGGGATPPKDQLKRVIIEGEAVARIRKAASFFPSKSTMTRKRKTGITARSSGIRCDCLPSISCMPGERAACVGRSESGRGHCES
jgi:hypothetical protein